MSELIGECNDRATIRWKLLAGVSAFAVTAQLSSVGVAQAEDVGRPTVWIELGGALSRLQDGQETFAPPLMSARPPIFEASQNFEMPPNHSFDGVGQLSIQPEHSSWVFSASVQYGRSKADRGNSERTNPLATTKYVGSYKKIFQPVAQRFADTDVHMSEQHSILDFQVGKDVGLGLFGKQGSSSLVSFGVRFAQFKSASNITLRSDPDWHFNQKYFDFPPYYHLENITQPFHTNSASMIAERSFRGIGPSVSWKSSDPLAGNIEDGEIVADWGVNAALLFGRQKTRTHHQSTSRYADYGLFHQNTAVPHTTARFPITPDHTRSRGVVVPNIGGFAGLSFRYPNAKISMGYRADFFFGAMDGGIDVRKTYDRGFFGPYATISIGFP